MVSTIICALYDFISKFKKMTSLGHEKQKLNKFSFIHFGNTQQLSDISLR